MNAQQRSGAQIEAIDRRQCAPAALMIRPAHFFVDPDTASSNLLQPRDPFARTELLSEARADFDRLAAALQREGVRVCVADAPSDPALPDAVFPNNWLSTHADGTVVLYPMLAPRRRLERRVEVIDALSKSFGFRVTRTIDLSFLEESASFVEGTGSLVLDRVAGIAFAALSARTTRRGVSAGCEALGYRPILFHARHADGSLIYHTNVMLSIGSRVAIGCFETIADDAERDNVLRTLRDSGRTIVNLSAVQMLDFAANCLELEARGTSLLVFSARAWAALAPSQRAVLETGARICIASIDTIERFGGGGVRCMLAELFLPAAK